MLFYKDFYLIFHSHIQVYPSVNLQLYIVEAFCLHLVETSNTTLLNYLILALHPLLKKWYLKKKLKVKPGKLSLI